MCPSYRQSLLELTVCAYESELKRLDTSNLVLVASAFKLPSNSKAHDPFISLLPMTRRKKFLIRVDAKAVARLDEDPTRGQANAWKGSETLPARHRRFQGIRY